MSATRETLDEVFTPQLGRKVYLRPDTSDRQVWNDTFGGAGGYHVPPREMPVPATVLDLGANIGLTAAHYQALWPDAVVWALEMDWDSFEVLVRNQDPTDWHTHCQWMAVGAVDGWTTYRKVGLQAEAYRLDDGGEEIVFCTTLRAWLDANGAVDFCKMDVEGAEWGIFAKPGWEPLVRHLLVELHGEPGEPSEEIRARGIAALEALGFEARHHPPHPQAVWAVRREA